MSEFFNFSLFLPNTTSKFHGARMIRNILNVLMTCLWVSQSVPKLAIFSGLYLRIYLCNIIEIRYSLQGWWHKFVHVYNFSSVSQMGSGLQWTQKWLEIVRLNRVHRVYGQCWNLACALCALWFYLYIWTVEIFSRVNCTLRNPKRDTK